MKIILLSTREMDHHSHEPGSKNAGQGAGSKQTIMRLADLQLIGEQLHSQEAKVRGLTSLQQAVLTRTGHYFVLLEQNRGSLMDRVFAGLKKCL